MGAATVAAPAQDIPGWVPAWLAPAWELLAAYPLLLTLAIMIGGALLAALGRGAVLFWGLKVTSRTSTTLDDQFVRLLAMVLASVVMMASLIAAVQSLPVGQQAQQILSRLLSTVLVLLLMNAGFKAIHLGLAVLSRIRDRFRIVEERTIPLFDLGLTITVVSLAVYALLLVWNINPTAWLASAGVIGIAVGFAARDTLANLFAGFFIIADAPYKLGDYIVLDNGERGEVTKVGIRSTRLLTRDDIEIIIPNSEMANTKIINESGGRWVKFRIRLRVGVAYGSDVDQVTALLERVALAHPAVCRDPEPRVRMRGFGDSSLDFELLCWIDHPSQRGRVAHDLYMTIYKELRRAGVTIPFPQRDVWLRREAAGSDGAEADGA
ncbi:MAG: mechanosensitive ion channel family protein [Candidatus Krumholzibacteria bacterium]|nr:mechanosensitive ion channel family protein [Candidatus Krumholzibacteria bacterium]